MIKYTPFLYLTQAETAKIRQCLVKENRIYTKNTTIMHFSDKGEVMGVVEKVLAYLVRIDIDVNRSILDYYEDGDVFSNWLYPNENTDEYYIIAKDYCRISYIDYKKLIAKCKNNCEMHNSFMNNLLMLSLSKTQAHIDILSQRSTRAKINKYFEYLSLSFGNRFTVPLSFTDLADYLSVDRSAMMRE